MTPIIHNILKKILEFDRYDSGWNWIENKSFINWNKNCYKRVHPLDTDQQILLLLLYFFYVTTYSSFNKLHWIYHNTMKDTLHFSHLSHYKVVIPTFFFIFFFFTWNHPKGVPRNILKIIWGDSLVVCSNTMCIATWLRRFVLLGTRSCFFLLFYYRRVNFGIRETISGKNCEAY